MYNKSAMDGLFGFNVCIVQKDISLRYLQICYILIPFLMTHFVGSINCLKMG